MFHYFAYGMQIESNVPILPLLPGAGGRLGSCLQVIMGHLPEWLLPSSTVKCEPWYISHFLDDLGQPALRVWLVDRDKYFYFHYTDGTEFILSQDGSEVWAKWTPDSTIEDTLTYLLGPIFGVVLRLRNTTCLHASAVLIGERVAVFIGKSGAGKSTTAAAFAQQGYPVLSDDVVALIDRGDAFWVQPAYPRIRLWKESVAALYDSPDALPRIVPTNLTWDKQYLDLNQPDYYFPSTAAPLGVIYLIGERSLELTAPRIEVMTAQKQLISLLGNTYASRFINKAMRSQEFEILSRLAKEIPVRQITPHGDIGRLPQMLDTVLADF
jgi:hypothetical protein